MAWAAGALVHVPAFDRFGWTVAGLTWGVAGTVPMLGALAWLVHTRYGPIARLVRLAERHLAPLFAGGSLADLVLVAVLAGIGEEALFRGVIQPGLVAHLPAWLAIGLTGLLFGAAHWMTPLYALLAAGIGGYLGALALASGNLLAPIVAHALYDVVALYVLRRRTR